MRKVVWSLFISADNVIENPGWSMPYWSDDIAAFKGEESEACDALLLGRVTYEAFAQAWPNSKDEGADFINALPKHVATRTLTTPEWNATFIQGDVVEGVRQLKQQAGKDLLMYGSGNLAQTLMRHDLIDQYNLLTYPIILGKGQRLVTEAIEKKLRLIESRSFSTGAVLLKYAPEG